MEKDYYENPLTTRYAGKEMSYIFSDFVKYTTWRKLWIALAEAQRELGLETVTKEQIDEMKLHAEDIDFAYAAEREKETRHDVMAHVQTFSRQCPKAAPVIHLGATSCFVTDNGDLLVYYHALEMIKAKLVNVIKKLASFAGKYKSLPTLGYTHLQPAQLTTVGKRAVLWAYDLTLDYGNISGILNKKKLRGAKGATGTQASYVSLFNGDQKKAAALDKLVAKKMGINDVFPVSGQTYTRKFDSEILKALSGIAESASKFASDLRLLQSMKEIEEPFEKEQVGSSAMAYKRNPMRCERMASLSRYLLTLPLNASITAASQWLERTLDDSANRRIVMAQAFLTTDAVLNIYLNVADGLVVNEKVIEKRVAEELPFMATENILMECVKLGGNRQELHEELRKMSLAAAENVKNGKECNLLALIKAHPKFAPVKSRIDGMLKPENFTGRSVAQVDEFIGTELAPILAQNVLDKTYKLQV